jgi:hypothetical protein
MQKRNQLENVPELIVKKKSSKRQKTDTNVDDVDVPQIPHEIAPGVIDLQPQAAELDDIPYTGPQTQSYVFEVIS